MDLDYLYSNQDVLLDGKTPEELIRQAEVLIWKPVNYFVDYTAAHRSLVDGVVVLEQVKPTDVRANCWNLEGALARVANPWGIVPPGVLRFLDEYMCVYVDENMSVPSTSFSSFGEFGVYASHAHALQFLDRARIALWEAVNVG
jgi:hypothetical protein